MKTINRPSDVHFCAFKYFLFLVTDKNNLYTIF